jgi:ketosteroid isomerase-like protein
VYQGAHVGSLGVADGAGPQGSAADARPQWIERLRTATSVATEFNDYVNEANLRALASLMSEDHRVIDSLGNMVSGKPACIAAWSGFFQAFPGYRNTFERFHEVGNTVLITGFSHCPNYMELTGPAIWTATVVTDRLTEWRVFEDTALNRMALGLYH